MKKLISLILALVMVMGLAVTASAEEVPGSITITNATPNVEYTIYKVFDLTYADTAVSYTYTDQAGEGETDALLDALTDTDSPFTLTESSVDGTYNVSTDADAEDIATWLKNNESLLTVTDSAVASAATLTFADVEYGYYYVTSTLGTVVTVNSAKPTVEITDKNEKPTADKKVKNGDSYSDIPNTANIGDTVNYKVEITVKTGAKNYVLHDTMTAGLTFDAQSVVVKVGDNAVAEENYTLSTPADGHTFDIAFDDTYLAGLAKDTVIIVEYAATLNEQAVIADNGNTNTIKLSYGDPVEVNGEPVTPETTEDTVTTYTYEFDLVKTTSDNALLDGAEFQLYTVDPTNDSTAEPMDLAEVSCGYRAPVASDQTTINTIVVTDGKITVSGLKSGTYYLVETVAPQGYNMLTEPEEFKIVHRNLKATVNGTTYVDGGVRVVNLTGSELPSTGGMGTTLFYVIGGLLMTGAAVLLITKKRMA